MTQTAAQAIARGLAKAGCRHVFGMPGGEVLMLLDALTEAGLEFTLCKHENAAGIMAEGSWQATGAPGILLTTIGPGLANGMNSIANAFQEQVPLIVLSGCIDDTNAEQFTHQVIDQSALLAPITKARFRVAPGTAPLVIEKALSIALADPPGPVHIDLPDTLARSEAPPLPSPARAQSRGLWGDGPSRRQAIERLRAAERPIVLAGIGAVLHNAGLALRNLCESHSIPLITTYKAKGILPEDHPLSLGGHGLSPLSDKTILPLLAQSDCVVLAGYDPIEMRSDWIRPWGAENAIELTHTPTEHGMHGSAIRFVGDVAQAVMALHEGLDKRLPDPWANGEINAAKDQLATVFSRRGAWGPHTVFAVLQDALPDGAVTTVDSGAHRILLSQMWRATAPRRLLQSAAFCTMGVAIPLAIGYKRASPDTPVLAVVGDAGFDMFAGELATLRDLQLPLAIVVLVDQSLALIEKKQTAMQLKKQGVSFGVSDFASIAKAYGGHGALVTTAEELQYELEKVWDRSQFTVIACPIERDAYNGAF